jgi:hypothetical protein
LLPCFVFHDKKDKIGIAKQIAKMNNDFSKMNISAAQKNVIPEIIKININHSRSLSALAFLFSATTSS